MGLEVISESLMVLGESKEPGKNRLLIISSALAILAFLIFLDPSQSISILSDPFSNPFSIVFIFGIIIAMLLFSTSSIVTLDKSSNKMIVERKSIFGSRKEISPLKKIIKLSVNPGGEGPASMSFLAADGAILASSKIYSDEPERIAEFLGVPLEDTRIGLKHFFGKKK